MYQLVIRQLHVSMKPETVLGAANWHSLARLLQKFALVVTANVERCEGCEGVRGVRGGD